MRKIYFLFLILGLGMGILWGLGRAKASSPEGESSGGEQPASVWYDEFWQATQAVVSTENGYRNFNPSTHNNTDTAAKFEDASKDQRRAGLLPKMVVTKWKVHGHIHFR